MFVYQKVLYICTEIVLLVRWIAYPSPH
ncbi:hypothetical protein JIP1600_2320012 [Flavobacterium psychrophilum]|nr:hypothetical protein FI146_760017 [Flavobacterium psychrophilum]SNB14324.1 hypothetical protein JIP1600_2320012 [Flavobacterium psychrophilum]